MVSIVLEIFGDADQVVLFLSLMLVFFVLVRQSTILRHFLRQGYDVP